MEAGPQEVTTWLEDLGPHERQQAEWLASLVHEASGSVTEAIKWRRLTFTLEDDWHHWLCQVAATKAGVSLVFHKGVLFDDPANLLKGEGRYLREVSFQHAVEHRDCVARLVEEAIEHQRDMLDE